MQIAFSCNQVHILMRSLDVFDFTLVYEYCKLASSNTSRLEAHEGLFRLLMKGIFDPYVSDL